VRIRRLRVETADITSFELVAVDGQPLQPFEAGAHIDVHLDGGLIRQYSLINTTATDGSYRITVKLEPNSRGGSLCMHRIAEGDVLTVSHPRNNFPLDPEAHTMLLAGGIGVTPLLGMAYRLMALGASFSLDYFARSRDALAFGEEIGSAPFASRSRFHLGLEGEAVRTEFASRLDRAPPGTHIYACGPAPSCRRFANSSRQSQVRPCIWNTSSRIPFWPTFRPVLSRSNWPNPARRSWSVPTRPSSRP
jgi:vanillate O-demethylase ferredoxin subunit